MCDYSFVDVSGVDKTEAELASMFLGVAQLAANKWNVEANSAFVVSASLTSTGSRQTPIGTVTGMRAQRGTTHSATEKSDLGNQGDRDQGVGRRNPHDLASCVMRDHSPEERRLGSVLKVFAGSDLSWITFRRVLPSSSPFHHLKLSHYCFKR